jgi:coproporphyrinogen III oxidase-like Fe-S oxidoreductase
MNKFKSALTHALKHGINSLSTEELTVISNTVDITLKNRALESEDEEKDLNRFRRLFSQWRGITFNVSN